jgi:hypothetical protein
MALYGFHILGGHMPKFAFEQLEAALNVNTQRFNDLSITPVLQARCNRFSNTVVFADSSRNNLSPDTKSPEMFGLSRAVTLTKMEKFRQPLASRMMIYLLNVGGNMAIVPS